MATPDNAVIAVIGPSKSDWWSVIAVFVCFGDLVRPIRMALPADYSPGLIEMNHQDSTLGPRAIERDKLLCFA
jgi:hypothetical protein